ncbi:hypothetical protein BBF96_15190 [Anoxybacter fermentans]|uniref:DUF501 domain-containing protein n=1 Tax=Anoxybacter fermentans TaxID=1323375 RepID=A0A3Q9HSD0_9FIRM|nr:DUF501 domain-containing protein [Anoxybacter fermentans]AZR74600.1 hypothetical protein BBF96_15190 [Anoxybacter fermentans]
MAKYEPLKEGDKSIITKQLGRPPRNLIGVAVRCKDGIPQVIVTHPVIFHGEYPEVFPTLYWLSCPRLVKEISRLEGTGAIEEIQDIIFNDPVLKNTLDEVYRIYADQRMALVKNPTLKLLKERHPSQYEVLLHSGVGGIMSQGIKCLHTHFADYLVNKVNPVGFLVAERLGDKINENCHQCVQE